MDRDRLKGWLDQGLSLPQIGALANRDPSTVGYWVQKHGLTANGRERYSPRGGLTREQLGPLAEREATVQEMADELGRSASTIRYWLKKYGLAAGSRRRRRLSQREIEIALENGSRSGVGRCAHHGETEFAIVGSKNWLHCKRCRAEAVARRRRKVKAIIVDEAGGKCQLCGYDRCISALEFHHRDPGQKSFGLAQRGVTRAIDEVREEARKCVLLCSNCHAEVEAGFVKLPLRLQGVVPRK